MRARYTTRRKTAPRVRDGAVQKKNRWASSPDADLSLLAGSELAFEERAPGASGPAIAGTSS